MTDGVGLARASQGNARSHDPLCDAHPNWTNVPCSCHVIAKVRADEREQAAQRVLGMLIDDDDDWAQGPWNSVIKECASVARGET